MSEPIKVLSMGAGVQSTTLLYMMLDGKLPKADHIVFADTGWEPQAVYDHLENLKLLIEKADIKFHLVRAAPRKASKRTITGDLRADALADAESFISIPAYTLNNGKKGMLKRQCTYDYKIQPVLKKLREIVGLKTGERCKEVRVAQMFGISLDESQRMRDPAFSWIRNDYPLVDLRITRQDCLNYCAEHGYSKPPRSACIGCPFKSNMEWRIVKETPTEWADVIDFDHQLRTNARLGLKGSPYLHSQCVPLGEADIRSEAEQGILSLFDMECEGMCGN